MFMANCRLCNDFSLVTVIEFGEHPISHHFLSSPSQSEYTHPVTLSLCTACGHVQLINPVPAEMFYSDYKVLSSWKNQPHIPHLLELIAQLPHLSTNGKILEVGSNDGIFLRALKANGFSNFLGVEPARDAREVALQDGLKTVAAYFNPETASELVAEHGFFDLFIARQVLEHISDLGSFREAMQR